MVAVTSSLRVADSYGRALTSPKVLTPRWVTRLIVHAIIGLTVLFINFPGYVKLTVEENIKNDFIKDIFLVPLNTTQEILLFVIGSEPISFFERAIACSFLMIFVWLLLSIFVSIRHKEPQWFFLACLGLSLGFFVLHLLAWTATGVVAAIDVSFIAFGWVKKVLGHIFNFTFDHRVIFFSIVATLIGFFIRKLLPDIWKWFVACIKKYWLKIIAAIAAIGISFLIVPFLWTKIILPIWNSILSPVFSWVLWLLSVILGFVISILFLVALIVIIPFTLAVLGSLLLAQLHAGWHAGRSSKYVLVAGFAIGSLLTLVLLTGSADPDLLSSLNRAWANIFFNWETQIQSFVIPVEAFNLFLPDKVDSFSKSHLIGTQAPVFDTVILLLVLTMAIVSLTERLLSSQKCSSSSIHVRFILTEYLKIIIGMFLALILIFTVGLATGD